MHSVTNLSTHKYSVGARQSMLIVLFQILCLNLSRQNRTRYPDNVTIVTPPTLHKSLFSSHGSALSCFQEHDRQHPLHGVQRYASHSCLPTPFRGVSRPCNDGLFSFKFTPPSTGWLSKSCCIC